MNEDQKSFLKCLKRVFGQTALVQVTQIRGWKLGKTDFSLKLAEMLLGLGIVQKVATNIFTHDEFEFVTDMFSLKRWLEHDNKTKLFILDEANEHFSNRRAMSGKNYSAMMMFPELSKHHARLIAVAQDFNIADPDLSNSTWVRGTFTKLSKTDVELIASFLDQPLTFHNITRTSVHFDQFRVAPFSEQPSQGTYRFKDDDFNKLKKIVEGVKWQVLGFKYYNEYKRWKKDTELKMLNIIEETNQSMIEKIEVHEKKKESEIIV